MTVPQILIDLMQLLFDLALPAAMCTMVLAGLALRQEGGVNFQAGGGFQKWIVWSAIFLTLPQLLAWFAGQGIALPPQASRQVTSPWLAAMETSFKSFVTNFIVGKLVPVAAAWAVLKAVLDAAQGDSPLGSIIAAFFLLTVSSLVQMMQGFKVRPILADSANERTLNRKCPQEIHHNGMLEWNCYQNEHYPQVLCWVEIPTEQLAAS